MSNITPVPAPQGTFDRFPAPVEESVLTEHAVAIRRLGRRVVADVIEIGRRLVDCRDNHLEHGEWLRWLKREFDWSRQTADRFIHVFQASGKLPNLSNLNVPLSGLYLLAAPSSPEAARIEIIERVEAGEAISHADVKNVIENARATSERSSRKGWSPEQKHARHGGDTAQLDETPATRDDVDATSASELARLTIRINELQAEQHRFEITVVGLNSEIDDLKTEVSRLRGENIALKSEVNELKGRLRNEPQNALAKDQGDEAEGMPDIPEFLRRAAPTAAGEGGVSA